MLPFLNRGDFMDYGDLVFEVGTIVGQSCIVFLLVALLFDFVYKMLFYNN